MSRALSTGYHPQNPTFKSKFKCNLAKQNKKKKKKKKNFPSDDRFTLGYQRNSCGYCKKDDGSELSFIPI